MQSVHNAELTEIPLESLLPVSTLRSTASPYKQSHNRTQSLFNNYLSQLTADGLHTPIDFSQPSRSFSVTSFTFSCSPIAATASTTTTHASTSPTPYSEPIKELDTQWGDEIWAETRPNSPVPSSPSSAAADLSSIFDNDNDEDDAATESDRPDSPAPYSSPFSSPLSTAPSSPASTRITLITIIPPEELFSTTEKRPQLPPPCPEPRDQEYERPDRGTHRKRARSASPPPPTFTRPTGRARASDPSHSSRSAAMKVTRSKFKPSRPSKPSSRSKFELSPDSQRLIGPLIQALALSGKSSLPTSIIVHELLASTPSLQSERTVEAWTEVVVETMIHLPVFGRAEGRGIMNADNEMVEDEWFYRPEMDDDIDRRGTLGAFQRGGGKRRATVLKKQYYWKPVK